MGNVIGGVGVAMLAIVVVALGVVAVMFWVAMGALALRFWGFA